MLAVEKELADEIAAVIGDSFEVSATQQTKMVKLLDQARKDVFDLIDDQEAEQWVLRFYDDVAKDVQEIMDELDAGLVGLSEEAAEDVIDVAVNGTDKLAKQQLKKTLRVAKLPRSMVKALVDYNADQIAGISKATEKAINASIKAGMMTGQSPRDVAKMVAPSLKDPSVFRTLQIRAEAIARTETNAVHSMASNERIKQIAKVVPGIGKGWVSVLDPMRTRESHFTAHFTYGPGGSVGAIDVEDVFTVGDSFMAFPGDPAGSAKERIHCMCSEIPLMKRGGR